MLEQLLGKESEITFFIAVTGFVLSILNTICIILKERRNFKIAWKTLRCAEHLPNNPVFLK